MPLTDFQRRLLADLAGTAGDDRYLAGGAALHFAPNSTRYSDDLDFFHDSEARVASAFAADRARLEQLGYGIRIELSLPGFVRAIVSRESEETRVDWAHDSAWRFMPLVRDPLGGLLLDPIDLAVNKVLALAGSSVPGRFRPGGAPDHLPVLEDLQRGTRREGGWPPGGPWRPSEELAG